MSISAKSKKSAKAAKASSRIPTAQHEAQAASLAEKYRITLWREDDQWWGRCVELPVCMGSGRTPQHAIDSTKEAIVAGLSTDLARGIPAPIPAREGVRSEQVNVRLSPDEREAIESSAHRAGFKGLADYIRAVSLGFPHAA